MHLKFASPDPLDDGWNGCASDLLWRDERAVSLSGGDTVLYRAEGRKAPAMLVAPAGGGSWLARGARLTRQLIYLAPESIVGRLPRNELRAES